MGGQCLFWCAVASWYVTNLLFNVGMKYSHAVLPDVMMLTTTQFAAGALCLSAAVVSGAVNPAPSWLSPELLVLSVLLLAGTLCTNISLVVLSVSFTHVIKTCEPLFTTVIVYAFDRVLPGPTAVGAIATTIVGVLIASIEQRKSAGKPHNFRLGIAVAILANFFLQLRNVLNKRMMRPVAVESARRGAAVNEGEAAQLSDAIKEQSSPIFEKPPPSPPKLQPSELLLLNMMGALLVQLLLHSLAFLTINPPAYASRYDKYAGASQWWLLVPPTTFVLYQLGSILVLARVDPVTHALLNALKRIVVIGLGAVYTGERLTVGFTAGVAVAVAGASAYSLAKVLRTSAAHVWLRLGMFALAASTVTASASGVFAPGTVQGATQQVVREAATIPWTICGHSLKPSKNCESETLLAPAVTLEELVGHGVARFDGQRVLNASRKPRGCHGRMLKVVAMHPAPSKHPPCLPNGTTFDAARETMTDNFGNMVWIYAARALLSRFDTIVVDSHHHSYPRGFVDAFVVAEANLLVDTKRYDLRGRAGPERGLTNMITRLFEVHDVPTLLASIGVQSLFSSAGGPPDIGDQPVTPITASSIVLHDEQHALLNALEQRAPYGYSVRGSFTAEVANVHGRRKAVALGCPSFMLNPDPCLGASLGQQFHALAHTPADQAAELKIAVLLPHPVAPNLLKLLIGICRNFPEAFIVVQTPGDYSSIREAKSKYKLRIKHTQVRYFYDIQAWRRALRQVDLVFGARIHGSMMGIYAGRPTLTIANDQRILEMVEQMMLPHETIFDMHDVPQNFHRIKEVLLEHVRGAAAKFDGNAFDRNRARIAQAYVRMFDGIGVNVSATVRKVSAGCSWKKRTVLANSNSHHGHKLMEPADAMPRARDSAPAAAPPPVVLLPPPPPRAISGMEAAGLVLLAFAAGAALGARLR